MGDPCKFTYHSREQVCLMTKPSRLAYNKTMQQKNETCPQTKQWWDETHILPVSSVAHGP